MSEQLGPKGASGGGEQGARDTHQDGRRKVHGAVAKAVAAEAWAAGLASTGVDQVYDGWSRQVSPHHWTSVAIARRAAKLLTVGGPRRILDVGSGVGKFCIVGALTTGAEFVGVEQRPNLVAAAQIAASTLGAGRARFVNADFVALDFKEFDAFYVFNPFEELVNLEVTPIDETVEISPGRFDGCVESLIGKLLEALRGARLLTYFGYGGPKPPGYRLVRHEPAGEDALVLWQKG
jgi:SAM-dependent methyltransferase